MKRGFRWGWMVLAIALMFVATAAYACGGGGSGVMSFVGGCGGGSSAMSFGGGCGGGYSAPAYSYSYAPVRYVMADPCGCAPTVAASASLPAAAPRKEDAPPPTPVPMEPDPAASTGRLRIDVPADTVLTVNGRATRKTGTSREFVAGPLEAGRRYQVVIEATVVRDGQTLRGRQVVILAAGDARHVAFTDRPVNTQLARR